MRAHRSLNIYRQHPDYKNQHYPIAPAQLPFADYVGVSVPVSKRWRLTHFYREAFEWRDSVMLPISSELETAGFREYNDYIYSYRTSFGLHRTNAIVDLGGIEYHIGFTDALTQIVRKGGYLVGLSQLLNPSLGYMTQSSFIQAPVCTKLPEPWQNVNGFTTKPKRFGFYDSEIPYIHVAEFRDNYVMHFITEAILS